MDSPLLPQEVIDAIIDHLWADTTSLKKCALVSSAWLSSARSHLFYSIHLDPSIAVKAKLGLFFGKQKKSPCEKLIAILKSSSPYSDSIGKISQYVREIHLCEGMRVREWLAHEPTLPSLLRSLHSVRQIKISRSASMQIGWDRLPEDLRAAILDHVLCLPSLTELKLGGLTLENLSVMKNLLRSCRQLRMLEVDHIWFADEEVAHLETGSMDEVVRERRLPLDVLVIGPRTSVALVVYLLHPSSYINVETIRKLTLSISSGTFANFARLLHASLSVEHLEVTLMNDVDLETYWKLPPQHQFDLSLVPHLQTLKVNIDVLQKMDPLPWLRVLLDSGSSLSRPNVIVKIWIIYTLYLPAPYMDRSLKTTIFDRWAEIDALLCGSGTRKDFEPGQHGWHAYERLKEVKLEFMLENPIGFGVAPRFLKEIVLDSPGLKKRGILSINAFDTSG